MRWFDTDEDYYAYMRVRSQFNSAEGYDQARAYFNSDAELFAYLERKHDDGYQQWMSQHGGTQNDSEEKYREYKVRSNDEIYRAWRWLYQKYMHNDDLDVWYKRYLEEKARYNSDEEYLNYLNRETEKRDAAEEEARQQELEQRRQRAKKLIDTGFGILAAVSLALGISNHWSIVVILILLAVFFVASRLVAKKVLDNIY